MNSRLKGPTIGPHFWPSPCPMTTYNSISKLAVWKSSPHEEIQTKIIFNNGKLLEAKEEQEEGGQGWRR